MLPTSRLWPCSPRVNGIRIRTLRKSDEKTPQPRKSQPRKSNDQRTDAPLEIRVQDLHKSFGDNPVLSGVSLDVHRGEMVAIVGASGSGKTVLLKHFIGRLQPDKGHVLLADHESPD